MTNNDKVDHHDRNDRIADNFFGCNAINNIIISKSYRPVNFLVQTLLIKMRVTIQWDIDSSFY